MYLTYGVRMDAKGRWAFGTSMSAASKRQAARQRFDLCSEMDGKNRVYKAAVTWQLYRIQTIPGAES